MCLYIWILCAISWREKSRRIASAAVSLRAAIIQAATQHTNNERKKRWWKKVILLQMRGVFSLLFCYCSSSKEEILLLSIFFYYWWKYFHVIKVFDDAFGLRYIDLYATTLPYIHMYKFPSLDTHEHVPNQRKWRQFCIGSKAFVNVDCQLSFSLVSISWFGYFIVQIQNWANWFRLVTNFCSTISTSLMLRNRCVSNSRPIDKN